MNDSNQNTFKVSDCEEFSFLRWIKSYRLIWIPSALLLLAGISGANLDYFQEETHRQFAYWCTILLLIAVGPLTAIGKYTADRDAHNERKKREVAEQHLVEQEQALELVRQRGSAETLLETIKLILEVIGKQYPNEPELKLSVWLEDSIINGRESALENSESTPVMIEQFTSVVGHDGISFEAGRKHPINCGIVGNTIRLRQPQYAKISQKMSNHKYYVEELNFTVEQASQLDLECKTMYCVPIMHKESVAIGAVYCSSIIPEFFGGPRNSRRKILQTAAPMFAQILFGK